MNVRTVTGTIAAAAGILVYRNAKAVGKQRSPFRRSWERHLLRTLDALQEADERGEDRPLIYVALGDSAAQGLGATTIEDGYVPRIAAALEAATGRNVALLNLSLSGGTVASVLGTQIPQLNGLRINGKPIVPDVVTLDIGSNDVRQFNVDLEYFEHRYRQMCKALPVGTFIADVPSFKPLTHKQRAKDISAIAARIMPEYGHHLVQLEKLSEEQPTSTYVFDYHAGDLFHPNSAWYERWAQLFLDEIARVRGVEFPDVPELPRWSLAE